MASNPENDRLIDEILARRGQQPKAATPEPVPTESVPQEQEPVYRAKHAYEPEPPLPAEQPLEEPVYDAPDMEEAEDEDDDYYEEEAPAPRQRQTRSAAPKKKKKRRKHKSARVYGVLIMIVLIFVISISLAIGIIQIGKDMLGLNGTEKLVKFTIPQGATTKEIAEDLYEAGIIEIPQAFIYFSRLSGADAGYVAGDHEVTSAMAYETLIDELTGVVEENRVTVDIMFREGITLYEAAQKLEEANVCDAQKFIYYFNAGGYGYEFESKLPTTSSKLKFYKMEGYFFPDTYTFYEEMEPDDVCRKIYMNFNQKITNTHYARMQELGLTLDETIILASVVQAEAGNADVMKDVASVFWNRLNNKEIFPMLQSDPTSKYVEEIIKPNIDLPDELVYDAYDTYVCSGLPAGAIGNPGIAAIEAVLYPNDTEYFYFYANVDTGITYFAKTLEEHYANEQMILQQQQEAAANGEGNE